MCGWENVGAAWDNDREVYKRQTYQSQRSYQ